MQLRMRWPIAAIVLLGMILLLALSMFMAGNSARATFASSKPELSISIRNAVWASYADYLARDLTVKFTLNNSSLAAASGVQITGATANNGVSLLSAMPLGLGDVGAPGSVDFDLVFDVPEGVDMFRASLSGTASDASGTSYTYPMNTNLAALAYIENTGGAGKIPTVDVLDMASMTIQGKFEDIARTGSAQGHFVSLSPDGRYIWHSEDAGASTGYVEVLDATTGIRVPGKYWAVGAGVGNLMTKLTVPGGHHYVFVTNQKVAPNGPSLTVFDVEAQAYLGEIPMPTGSAPHLIVATPDEKTIWTYTGSGPTSRAISFDVSGITQAAPGSEVIPTTIKDSVTIGGGLHAMVMHPNGKYLFMGSSDPAINIAIVDIDPANGPPHVEVNNTTGIGSSHNFTISPDGSHLLVGETGAYT